MVHSKVIAKCVATAGYVTCDYNPETGDCEHECYAGVDDVILNDGYWAQYGRCMSNSLNSDFELGSNFNTYRLRVYEDGTRQAEVLHA